MIYTQPIEIDCLFVEFYPIIEQQIYDMYLIQLYIGICIYICFQIKKINTFISYLISQSKATPLIAQCLGLISLSKSIVPIKLISFLPGFLYIGLE